MTDYIDADTPASITTASYIDSVDYKEVKNVKTVSGPIGFEFEPVQNFDSAVVTGISTSSSVEVSVINIHTVDYYNNPWNLTVTSGSTAYPTAGSIGTSDDNGSIT